MSRRAIGIFGCVVLLGAGLGGCTSDDTTAGSGQDAGGPQAGSSGSDGAGTGGAGTLAVDAGNGMSTHPNSAQADVDAVCKTFVDCDLIPGKDLTMSACDETITDDCVACALGNDSDAGVDDGGAPGCPPRGDQSCSNQCSTLIAPPATTAECLEIQAVSPTDYSEAYNNCVCTDCLQNYADCKADEGCWDIVECAVAVGCTGMGCYTPQTCMDVIDRVGATAIGTVLSTDFGTCTSMCPK